MVMGAGGRLRDLVEEGVSVVKHRPALVSGFASIASQKLPDFILEADPGNLHIDARRRPFVAEHHRQAHDAFVANGAHFGGGAVLMVLTSEPTPVSKK